MHIGNLLRNINTHTQQMRKKTGGMVYGSIMSSNKSDEIFQYTGRETIPKDVTIVHFHCNVTSIDVETFYECSKLKVVVLNNGLQTVGMRAFAQCKSLERITLHCTVTSIGMEAFFECTSLKEVVLNEGLKKIGSQAFEKCNSLQSITIPSSMVQLVQKVKRGSFE